MANLDKLNSIATNSGVWLKDAERRQRWRWLTSLTNPIKIKYYRFKRKINYYGKHIL